MKRKKRESPVKKGVKKDYIKLGFCNLYNLVCLSYLFRLSAKMACQHHKTNRRILKQERRNEE